MIPITDHIRNANDLQQEYGVCLTQRKARGVIRSQTDN
jgi:hypothetical protein